MNSISTSMAFLLAALVASAFLTGLLRRYAIARQVLDIPNDRSSHTVPTPRGGGVAIVLVFLSGLAGLAAIGEVDGRTAVALGGGGLLIAGIGFADDHGGVPIRWRLLAHFAAAAWGLWWLGGLPALTLFGANVQPGIVLDAVAVVALVWLLNLYNFMDGIDGIAGVEAVTVTLGGVILARAAGFPAAEGLLPSMLGAAVLGFLLWNYPPARIFMGDAGSGFLGLVLGLLAVRAGHLAPELLVAWTILLGTFVVDATVTLVTRAARGGRVHEAHRSHAYQHAARAAGSHRRVTLAVGLINMAWLLPWALAVVRGLVPAPLGLLGAYLPLTFLALKLRAGQEGP